LRLIHYLESFIHNEMVTAKIDVASLSVKKLSKKDGDLMYELFIDNIKKDGTLTILGASDVVDTTTTDDEERDPFDMSPKREPKSPLDKAISHFTSRPPIANKVKNILQEMKSGPTYFQASETSFQNASQFFFVIKDKLYFLVLREPGPYGIIFDTVKRLKDLEEDPTFSANNIMRSKDAGSKLFNMISGIVKKEIKTWKSHAFYFDAKLEAEEENRMASLQKIVTEIGMSLAYCSDLDESLEDRQKYLQKTKKIIEDKVSSFKNPILIKIKNIFLKSISNDTNNVGGGIIDFLLFNEPQPTLENLSYKYKNISIASQEFFDEIENLVSRNVIYKKIIKQMFGDKVIFKNRLGKLYFSLSKQEIDSL
jgi:hypothetical protein